MGLNESDTHAKLIDPSIHTRDWTGTNRKREGKAA
jgi:hypothetical protein